LIPENGVPLRGEAERRENRTPSGWGGDLAPPLLSSIFFPLQTV